MAMVMRAIDPSEMTSHLAWEWQIAWAGLYRRACTLSSQGFVVWTTIR
jgi:hypothetical protein